MLALLLLLLLYNQLVVQTCLFKAESICTPQLLQCR
jgi:hypothetical protein